MPENRHGMHRQLQIEGQFMGAPIGKVLAEFPRLPLDRPIQCGVLLLRHLARPSWTGPVHQGGLSLLAEGGDRAVDRADGTAQALRNRRGLLPGHPQQNRLAAAEFDLIVRFGDASLNTPSHTSRHMEYNRA
jgi:hypothetical protein